MGLPIGRETTMLVDCGVTEHFLDDELIPIEGRVLNCTGLDKPKHARAAGKHLLISPVSSLLPEIIIDETREIHD